MQLPRSLACAALLAPAALAQTQGDPFAPGLRWEDAAEPVAPWIPRDLAFVGEGELLWAAPAVQSPHLALYATAELPDPGAMVAPLFRDDGVADAVGPVRVAAGDRASELFAVAQYPEPGGGLRRTEVTRHDAEEAARGAPFAPRWRWSFPLPANGPAAIACPADGSFVAAAAFDATAAEVELVVLDAEHGAPLRQLRLAGTGLGALEVSRDGSRLALAAGAELYVLDPVGSVHLRRTAPAATLGPALSGDGQWLVTGGAGVAEVHHDGGAGYALVRTLVAPAVRLCVSGAVAADGGAAALLWWDASNGTDLWLEVYDLPGVDLRRSYAQIGSPTGLQNFPVAVELSGDGARVAAAFWGVGDGRPEWVLLDRANPSALLEADLPGSALALALDPAGGRVAVASKDAHANRFGSTGRVGLYDTGERDLQLGTAARLGRTLRVILRMQGGGAPWFAFGETLPVGVPSFGGTNWLDFGRGVRFLPGTVGAAGEASVERVVPADPSLVGLSLGIQAAEVGPAGVRLARTLVRPPIL